MCKHILITNYQFKDHAYVESFMMKSLNEKDGYGCIIKDKSNKIFTFRDLNLPRFYLLVGRWLNSGSIKDIVIHHRTSTNGDGIEYAHPFKYQGNYLTHNGVVWVPGEHKTKTTNDSEELLHHLIKTGYDTKSVSGYYSCFIINKNETIVLVDNVAPMYTNGRVFCSHDLSYEQDKFTSLDCVKMTLDNGVWTTDKIDVAESDYGNNLKYLSLGHEWESEVDYSRIDQLFDVLNDWEMEQLFRCSRIDELKTELRIIAGCYNIDLTNPELDVLASEFLGKESYQYDKYR